MLRPLQLCEQNVFYIVLLLQSRLKMIMNCTIAAMLVPIMQGACLSEQHFKEVNSMVLILLYITMALLQVDKSIKLHLCCPTMHI